MEENMNKSYAIKFSKLSDFLIPRYLRQSMFLAARSSSLCSFDSYIRRRFCRHFTISRKVNRKPEDMTFVLEEKKGDLFKATHSSDSLAHCVSVDLRMSKGIAVTFKKGFGGLEDLKKQGVKVGGVGVLERDGRYIYYLVTKEKYFHKPTYESQKSCLIALRDHCVSHSVHRLAMPRIGCGLDLLQWQQVRQDLKDVFKDTDIHITVYTLE